jgi:hypothetical protein
MIQTSRTRVKNAADETEVNKAREFEKIGRERELADMQHILGSPQGRRFLWRYLETCGIYRSSFTGSSETFYLEGQRNIGLKLLADITEASPESYMLMMKEQKQRENNNE